MWELKSFINRHRIYFNSSLMAEVYGLYSEWKVVIDLLNKELPEGLYNPELKKIGDMIKGIK